jgi:uncharacterized protein YecT (DUF1311 family)
MRTSCFIAALITLLMANPSTQASETYPSTKSYCLQSTSTNRHLCALEQRDVDENMLDLEVERIHQQLAQHTTFKSRFYHAQKTWHSFRNLDCEAMSETPTHHHSAALMFTVCMHEHAKTRLEHLRAWYAVPNVTAK